MMKARCSEVNLRCKNDLLQPLISTVAIIEIIISIVAICTCIVEIESGNIMKVEGS